MNSKVFSRISESLRQYRRADLRDFEEEVGKNAVEKLYCDPLPNDAVLNSVLSGNTTFLLGRKGTGKSTIFARAQSELRSKDDVIAIYVDVKSIYDIMRASNPAVSDVDLESVDLGVYREHLLRKHFLGASLAEILLELDKAIDQQPFLKKITGGAKHLKAFKDDIEKLKSRVETSALESQEVPILRQLSQSVRSRSQNQTESGSSLGVNAKLRPSHGYAPEFGMHATVDDVDKSLEDNELYNQYSDVVLRSFPFSDLIAKIQRLLSDFGMSRLVVFFDDFSELSYVDQRLFVDVILAPLNNSSNESVKLKVAGYPGRVYYGKIDPGKVDTISLDFSSLYEAPEVQTMELSAVDYCKRLLKSRFSAFGEKFDDYFDDSVGLDDHVRLLFQASFNVPRLIGIFLHTCYMDRVSKGLKINSAAIKLAARKHYEGTVLKYFDRMNRYALEPFENKLDRHNQAELIKVVTAEARRVRNGILSGGVGGVYFRGISNPPVSHFIVDPDVAPVFDSLESNFLVSRYKETRDKNGRAVVVFAMFYGLTEAERFAWGYPSGRDYRNYFVQRCFDFTSAIQDFLSNKQTIRCSSCGSSFSLDQKSSFELFKWNCPECKSGTCSVVDLADDFSDEERLVDPEAALDPIEIQILTVLDDEGVPMRASEISALIDSTYQLVGKRTTKLHDVGLVQKQRDEKNGKMRSEITDRAKRTYFVD